MSEEKVVLEKFMTSKDVVDFYIQLENMGIGIWVDGGWSVDALLGKQLRPHKDLDIAIQWKDVSSLREVLTVQGYKQVREYSQWNFVLADDKGHEIDVHAFIYDDKGNIVKGIMYPAESLTGTGTINGHTVRCILPKYQVKFLAPWIHKWPEKYLEAVSALCEKFDIEYPEEYTHFKK
ncbi:MAG: aminoglycoside nucleotidyltransferase [Candidatus Liptonbacteria bacterium]|nr:aminoglycoside nucleotidyltransferase [Candidatus Liptonbacteria bacterium]